MTRSVSALALLLLLAVAPLLAAQTKLVDDVIRMSRASVSDEAIIAFVQGTRDRAAVTADEVIAMSQAGVSKAVMQAMIADVPATAAQDASGAPAENPAGGRAATADAEPPDAEPPTSEAEPSPVGVGCWVFDPPIYYGPFYPSPIWDPFWYQPRLDTKSGAPASRGHAGTPVGTDRDHRPIVRREKSTPAHDTPSHESSGRSHGGAARRH